MACAVIKGVGESWLAQSLAAAAQLSYGTGNILGRGCADEAHPLLQPPLYMVRGALGIPVPVAARLSR